MIYPFDMKKKRRTRAHRERLERIQRLRSWRDRVLKAETWKKKYSIIGEYPNVTLSLADLALETISAVQRNLNDGYKPSSGDELISNAADRVALRYYKIQIQRL